MSQTVVVTGASAGVGRATVREFAKRGAAVGLIARGAAGLEAARAEAEELGAAKVAAASADVADAGQLASATARLEAELGPFDVWVNDAMVSVFAPIWEIAPAEFQRVMEVDYLGYVYGTLEALARMRPRNRGTIVQVGSALAYRGIPGQAPYCAAKHAVQGFVDSLRAELFADGSGVRVTMVQLPALNTPQFGWVRTRLSRHPQPVPPIFQPEVAARGVVWAAEHAPRELNVGGSTVLTRLGNALAPGLLDRYLGRTGISAQQTGERVSLVHWDDNVDQPVDATEDRGAHGVFDDKSHERSWQLTARMHRRELAAAAGSVAALAATAVARRRRSS
jgi:NAD(P)-dependent dehydrogenase (short-subunit alcohol dehydrogenase family)